LRLVAHIGREDDLVTLVGQGQCLNLECSSSGNFDLSLHFRGHAGRALKDVGEAGVAQDYPTSVVRNRYGNRQEREHHRD